MTESLAIDIVPGDGSNAAYALLGVIVTAVVTLFALLIKYLLDQKSERLKYARDIEVRREEHEREIEKLRLQAAEMRTVQGIDTLRRVAAVFLGEVQRIYIAINDARRHRRGDHDNSAYVKRLLEIPSTPGQLALDELGFVSHNETQDCADQLWRHVRGHDVAHGQSLASSDWTQWKDSYWSLRKRFVLQCKADIEAL